MAHDYPYFDHEFVPLSEYIPPLGVTVDNDTCDDFNIIKVVGANRYGILLKIIQVMSDLDLFIYKSYISSDGSWFMNSFHVTDPQGHKVRDSNLIKYMQESLNLVQKQKGSCGTTQVKIRNGNIVTSDHFGSDCAALEMSFFDRPGIFSEISALLFEHSYFIYSGDLWTYNGIVACILYIKEQDNPGQHVMDKVRLDYLEEYVANILEAQQQLSELFTVEVKNPPNRQIHTERRLHQLMNMYINYDIKKFSLSVESDQPILATTKEAKRNFGGVVDLPQVLIENWKDKDYLVLKVRSRDRPKLIFDVVCTLTDLNYDIFHGSICSEGDVIVQEYSVRRTNGSTILDEMEKHNTFQSLVAAVERRISKGLRMEMLTFDRHDLLSKVSRTLKENNLSLKKMKFAKENGSVVGSFYITDASSSTDTNAIDQQKLAAVCHEIGGGIFFEKKDDRVISSSTRRSSPFTVLKSLGRSVWSHIKRLFNTFSCIRYNFFSS